MSRAMARRTFVQMVGAAGLTMGAGVRLVRGASANSRVRVAAMGMGGRGTTVASRFASHDNTEVVYTCDVDKQRAGQSAEAVGKARGARRVPEAITDFRRFLDDKELDVVIIATCNHWHAPAAIAACGAGKHVYVEKPCSHNPWEGETLVAAARKHKRHVQMGNQRRSWAACRKAVEELRDGVIGRVYYAQAYYNASRPTIGTGKLAPPPEGIDWDLWQGPAPRKPFKDNYLHYNWHWFWHWGNGELGNNGVHTLDVCRWGLSVDYPMQVNSTGGRYRWQDDQETPDTNVVAFNFEGGRTISWEGLSCNRRPIDPRRPYDIVFHGEGGSLAIHGSSYAVFDVKNNEVKKETGSGGEIEHTRNLLDAIRDGATLFSEIEEGHKSTLMCHLGNIAYRVGRSLKCDPRSGRIVGDEEAMKHWKRSYEPGWEPRV